MHDLSRYHRQMLLPGIGREGQERLRDGTAVVIGCGALGTFLADLLARAGVGRLLIIDRDVVEITNLQRQVLFDERDVERCMPKAEAAKEKIAHINSQVNVVAVVDDLNHTNIDRLLGRQVEAGGPTVLVDGLDNFETRFLVNDWAVKRTMPYVYGGAVGTVGMTMAILPHAGSDATDLPPWQVAGFATPCLRCVFDQAPPPGLNPTCDTAGVLGPLIGIIAGHEAAEALKILTGNFAAVNRDIVHVDLWSNTQAGFAVQGAYDTGNCACCRQRRFEYLEGKLAGGTTTLCGRNAVQLSHGRSDGNIDFNRLAERLEHHGSVKTNRFMVRADIVEAGSAYELTLFKDGRAIVKGTEDQTVARRIYAKYIGG